MKLCGDFLVRQVMDNIVAIPVGKTALQFNGMIMLNDVSRVIWQCLEQGADMDTIVTAVTDAFSVERPEAQADILEFCDKLRQMQLLEN